MRENNFFYQLVLNLALAQFIFFFYLSAFQSPFILLAPESLTPF